MKRSAFLYDRLPEAGPLQASVRAGTASKPQTVTHVNHNLTHNSPHQHTHTHIHSQTHRSSTSITIIHQIYLHWSRTKIKLSPLGPPTLAGHPRPNPITARYLLWLIGFQSNWISLRWRWEEERLPCSKPLGIGIGRRARRRRGAKWGYRREMGKRREVIEGDWGRAR